MTKLIIWKRGIAFLTALLLIFRMPAGLADEILPTEKAVPGTEQTSPEELIAEESEPDKLETSEENLPEKPTQDAAETQEETTAPETKPMESAEKTLFSAFLRKNTEAAPTTPVHRHIKVLIFFFLFNNLFPDPII